MEYRIFDTKRKTYLDRNLYYVSQKGQIFKKNMPFDILVSNQEKYKIIIVNEEKNEKYM